MMELILLFVLVFLPNKYKWLVVKYITTPFLKLREWAWGQWRQEEYTREMLYKKYGIEVI